MKKPIFISIAITVLLILCTFDDFLSLHDIKSDYVSQDALSYLHIETSAALPTWTDTRLEWTSVTISFALRSILIVANLAILLLLVKRLPDGKNAARLYK